MTNPKPYRTPEEEADIQQAYREYRARMDQGTPWLRLGLAIGGFGALLAGLAAFIWSWVAGQ